MKKLLTIVFLLCAVKAISQDQFTGKIVFDLAVSGEEAEQVEVFMPTSYTFYLSGDKSRFEMNGGLMAAMMGYVIHDGENTYMVHDDDQTAYKLIGEEVEEEVTPNPNTTVTKLDETETILGYKCTKYSVVTNDGETATIQYVWATAEVKIKLNEASGGNTFAFDGVEGFPLKIESTEENITVTMTVKEIDKTKPAKTLFEIPSNYTIEEMDPKDMFGKF